MLSKLTRSFSMDAATGASLRSGAERWCELGPRPRERAVVLVLRNVTRRFAHTDRLVALVRRWVDGGLVPGASWLHVLQPGHMSFCEQVGYIGYTAYIRPGQ